MNMVLSGHNFAQAQQFLIENATTEGYSIKLIMISDDQNNDINLRVFALTEFSRIIKDHWRPKNGRRPLQDKDRDLIRGSLLDAVIRCDGVNFCFLARNLL